MMPGALCRGHAEQPNRASMALFCFRAGDTPFENGLPAGALGPLPRGLLLVKKKDTSAHIADDHEQVGAVPVDRTAVKDSHFIAEANGTLDQGG